MILSHPRPLEDTLLGVPNTNSLSLLFRQRSSPREQSAWDLLHDEGWRFPTTEVKFRIFFMSVLRPSVLQKNKKIGSGWGRR